MDKVETPWFRSHPSGSLAVEPADDGGGRGRSVLGRTPLAPARIGQASSRRRRSIRMEVARKSRSSARCFSAKCPAAAVSRNVALRLPHPRHRRTSTTGKHHAAGALDGTPALGGSSATNTPRSGLSAFWEKQRPATGFDLAFEAVRCRPPARAYNRRLAPCQSAAKESLHFVRSRDANSLRLMQMRLQKNFAARATSAAQGFRQAQGRRPQGELPQRQTSKEPYDRVEVGKLAGDSRKLRRQQTGRHPSRQRTVYPRRQTREMPLG